MNESVIKSVFRFICTAIAIAIVVSIIIISDEKDIEKRKESAMKGDVVFYGNGQQFHNVYRFKLKGHSYIQFNEGRDQWGVHDPDCDCKIKQVNTKNE